jgi:hypothetical protein
MRHLFFAAAMAAAPLGGCASLNSVAGAVSDREIAMLDPGVLQGVDIDVLAFAGAGAWRAVQAEAVRLVQLEDTPVAMKAAIARADRIGTPLIIELTVLAESYGALKSIGRAGDAEREVVGAEIERLLPRADANIREFATTVTRVGAPVEGAGE